MHIPSATYRVQLHSEFGFSHVQEILPYLAELGMSDIYAAPIFKARRKSTHGYDIVDPTQLNPELGTPEEFAGLIAAAAGLGLRWLQDIVPNHMAYDSENEMLMDVFENGPDSLYVKFFDIDWNHIFENMRKRVLAPFLGSFYGDALEKGEIQLRYDERGLHLTYYALCFPVRVKSYVDFLSRHLEALERRLTTANSDFINLLGAMNLFKSLSDQQGDIAQSEQVRHTKTMLWTMCRSNPVIREHIDANLVFFNGRPGDPSSFDALDTLISEQFYRLSYWKVAAEEINYRRFFTVNELISMRVEDDAVFQHTHRLILELVRQGKVAGLRIDHLDGLRDPISYVRRLRTLLPDTYMVAEKILARGETLPADVLLQGTTGYDALNYINGVFCDQRNAAAFTELFQNLSGLGASFERMACDIKRLIVSKHLAGNIDNLAHMMKNISARDRQGRDVTLYGLRRALVEVMAHFPVYRTYMNFESTDERGTRYIQEAIDRAKDELPGSWYELSFIEQFLLLRYPDSLEPQERRHWVDFVMHFQQYTGPLMAKGVEDTLFYSYNRLISLNEVGAGPERFGCSLREFHEYNERRVAAGDLSLTATATHDTKRGEDVRARINVLSEMPEEWGRRVRAWQKMNERYKTKLPRVLAPDGNDEYFMYQTLVGALPFGEPEQDFTKRMTQYIVKAVREAKRHTAWIKPDSAYEGACVRFLESVLKNSAENEFLNDFIAFQKKIAAYGIYNSLSQVALKIAGPGVADFYQGTELWDFSLVDPDNRRPVDFSQRNAMLGEIKQKAADDVQGLIGELFACREDGRLKLFVIYSLLRERARNAVLFQKGAYLPLMVSGAHKDHLIAFARHHEGEWAICVAVRWLTQLIRPEQIPIGGAVWADTGIAVPPQASGEWQDAITGQIVSLSGVVPAGSVLHEFPLCLLVKKK